MSSWSLDGQFSHLKKMIRKPPPERESNFKGQYHFGVIAVRRRRDQNTGSRKKFHIPEVRK